MLKVENLKVHYPIRGGFFNTIKDHVYAVDGVDIEIEAGKTYGLIGESGSGKTTVGKVIFKQNFLHWNNLNTSNASN